MYHTDNAGIGVRGWAVGAWTVLVMATILGLLSGQASQLMSDHFPFGGPVMTADASAAEVPERPAAVRRSARPIILTIPLAVTRTQRMMVARMKHRGEFGARTRLIRRELSAQGLLAGLALIGASQGQAR